MHICTDFVDVGLGLDSSINSEIDEVLTVDLAWRNDCQLVSCDKSDPLLDTDGSTARKFASRGISSGAIAAQSIQHSGLLC